MNRPRAISAICILAYATAVFTFPQVFSPTIKKLGLMMPAIYGILVAANFIGSVGLWYFKQWGAELFLISFFAKTLFYILTEQTGFTFYLGLVLNILFIFILLRFYSKMSPNL